MTRLRRTDRGSALPRALGIGALAVFFVVALAALALFTFAVTVDGRSMEPTLRTGDRLSANFLSRDGVERFDLVEITEPGKQTRLVKRVIGMPGDTLWVETVDGRPHVLIVEAGTRTVRRVVNPTWDAQTGDAVTSCCDANGAASVDPERVTVPDDHYWVVGDNWGGSTDSRAFGFVGPDEVKATLNFRLLPLSDFGRVPQPPGLGLLDRG